MKLVLDEPHLVPDEPKAKSPFRQGLSVLANKQDLSDIWTATKMLATGSSPFKGEDEKIAGELYDRFKYYVTAGLSPVLGRAADLMGLLDYGELKKELKQEAEGFGGFGPALIPTAVEAGKTAFQWGWLYPKLFKLAGLSGETIKRIPTIKKGIQALEQSGGIEAIATKYPRLFQSGTDFLGAVTKGYGVGATTAGLEAIGEDMSAVDILSEMNERGKVMGTVAGAFSIAGSIDTTLYANKLRSELINITKSRYDAKIRALPKGMANPRAKIILEQEHREIRAIDNIVAAVETELRGIKSGELYKAGQEKYKSPLKSAERIAKYGWKIGEVYPKGLPGLKKGLLKREPFIKMPTTKVEQVRETFRNIGKSTKEVKPAFAKELGIETGISQPPKPFTPISPVTPHLVEDVPTEAAEPPTKLPAAAPVAEVPAEGIKVPPKPTQAKPEAIVAEGKVMFHGGKTKVTKFDAKKIGTGSKRADWGYGFYFGTERITAEKFGKVVTEATLDYKNPYKIEALDPKQTQRFYDEFGVETGTFKQWVQGQTQEQYFNEMKSRGYDAVEVYDKGKLVEIVVFDASQIKPAPATEKAAPPIKGQVPERPVGLTRDEATIVGEETAKVLREAQLEGAKVGYKIGDRQARSEMRTQIAKLQAEKTLTKTLRNDTRKLIQKAFGTTVPKKFLTLINKTTNKKDIDKAIQAVEETLEKVDRKQAIKELNTLTKKLKGRIGKTMQEKGIRPEYAKKLNTLMDSFSTKKLSQWRMKDIQSLGQYLRNLKEGISNDTSLDEVYRAKLAESLVPERRLAQLGKLSQSSIHLLKAEDIRTITAELQRLAHLNDVKNKIYLNRKARHTAEYLNKAIEEQVKVKDESKLPKEETMTTRIQPTGVHRTIWRFVAGTDNHDMKTLVWTIEGGKEDTVADIMVENFRDGRRIEADHKVGVYKYIRDYLDKNNIADVELARMSPAFQIALRGEKGQKVRKAFGKQGEMHKVKIAGREINLTMAEMMSIYMHAQSDFNLKAMLKEGIASILEEKGALSPEELGTIIDIVRSDKSAFALTKMYQYIAENINRPAINKASMDLKGIEIADVENYFTVERYTRGKVSGNQEYQINLLESMGFLQERTGSKNPIVIRDFFSVLLANVDGVSEYVGMAKPYRAAHTILGYKDWAKLVDSKGHELQRRHLNTMMERTEQRPRVRGRVESIFMKPLRGVTRAVLANPGIWIGQITSEALYASANVAIPKKYLARRFVPSSKEVDRVTEHFPWAWVRRNLGVTSIATRDISRTDLALRAFTGKQSIMNLTVAPINYVDMKAISYGWLATEKWVKDTTNLKGQEFYDEVNKRAHKIISETQPMFEPENRSILTSSPNVLVKSFVLFRSYVDQTLRLMARARTSERNGVRAKGHTAAVAGVILASFVAWKLMRILVDALLFGRKRDPYEVAKDVGTSPLRVFTVVGYPVERLVSRMIDARFGKRLKPSYFEANFENIVTSTINEVWGSFRDFATGATYLGTGEVYKSGDNKGELKSRIMLARATENLTYSIGKLLGLPTPAIQKLKYGWFKKKPPFKKARRKPVFRKAG